MSLASKHIINKQIIELYVSKTMNSLEVQQTVSKLYKEKMELMISNILDKNFGNSDQHYQVDTLTVDLGEVTLEDLTAKFSQKLAKTLQNVAKVQEEKETVYKEAVEKKAVEKELQEATKTPLKVLAYYLLKGRLPWWTDNTKVALRKHLNALVTKPTSAFKKVLTQLKENPTYLQRYVQTFSEEQLVMSLQIATGITKHAIAQLKKETITSIIAQDVTQKTEKHQLNNLKMMFFKALFLTFDSTKKINEIKSTLVQQMALELGIQLKKEFTSQVCKEILAIRALLKKQQHQFVNNSKEQQLFKEIHLLINKSVTSDLPIKLLKELRQLLHDFLLKKERLVPSKENINNTDIKLITLAKHVIVLKKIVNQEHNIQTKSLPLESKITEFDDTDFISIENGGIVLLWPFLQRFFENLNLLEDKAFVNEDAKHKAVSILHYLCDSEESELFEGLLPLIKILCGIAVEDPVAYHFPSQEEKEIADDFLEVIIQQGKCWGTISKEGFRASYLLRQASLKVRDDHWLLQVEKKTYDIVMQKLPWSMNAVKLPWMEKLIMVEWM